MATKAELEAEVERLRAELGARGDEDPQTHMHDVLGALKSGDLEGLANELAAEIEDSLTNKPLLTAAGLVLLGYALGRAR